MCVCVRPGVPWVCGVIERSVPLYHTNPYIFILPTHRSYTFNSVRDPNLGFQSISDDKVLIERLGTSTSIKNVDPIKRAHGQTSGIMIDF